METVNKYLEILKGLMVNPWIKWGSIAAAVVVLVLIF
jgi:hypothetical protein